MYDGDPEDALYATDKRGRLLRLIPQHSEQVADALERLAVELHGTRDDLGAWKWAIIAAHSALQNAMADVVPLEGSSLQRGIKKAWQRFEASVRAGDGETASSDEYIRALARRINADEPTGYLQDFTDLWETTRRVRGIGCDGEEDNAIRRLNRERNKFVHLGGEVANFDLRDYPSIVLTCMEVHELARIGEGSGPQGAG